MNLWASDRKLARGRMRRAVIFKRACTEQLKRRTINVIKRRLGRSYTVLMTPYFKKARSSK